MTFRLDGIDVHLDEHGAPRIVERQIVCEPELAGLRLDHFLVRKIPRLSRTRAQAVIRNTARFADGRVARPNSRVVAGDTIVMRREAQPEPPCPRRFDVLHRDQELMVIDKPAGLPVHCSARFYFNTLTRVVSERFPGQGWQICHRLDRETSGALVLARGRAAAATVKAAFANKQTRKSYVAIAYGTPAEQSFRIEKPLGLTRDEGAMISLRMVVRDDALEAVTEVEVALRLDGFSVLHCRPISGRQHQIRAHLAAIGHPIVGDKLYAHSDEMFAAACDGRLTSADRRALLLDRHALHAQSIEVPHPSGERLRIEAPMPRDLGDFIESRRLSSPGCGSR